MSKLLMAPVALAVGLSLAGASFAQPALSDAPRQVVVKHGDLNLANAAGVTALRGRIHLAAQKVCGPEPTNHDIAGSTTFRRCVARAQTQTEPMLAEMTVGTQLAEAR